MRGTVKSLLMWTAALAWMVAGGSFAAEIRVLSAGAVEPGLVRLIANRFSRARYSVAA